HVTHPKQPPFPTRRSSDLVVQGICCCGNYSRDRLHEHSSGLHCANELHRSLIAYEDWTPMPPYPEGSLGRFGPRLLLTLAAAQRDRKSTRLNSSHQIISYA